MTRNGVRHTYVNKCSVCGKHYDTKSLKSDTCSGACRTKKSRAAKQGNGRTWHHVRPSYQAWAQEISGISKTAYKAIQDVLEHHGAIAAEFAIYAAYSAIQDVLDTVERTR